MTNEEKKGKILIVEDDDMLRNLLLDQIGESHVTVSAGDGQVAMQEVKNSRPDVIILDLMLPVVTGFEFLKSLREMQDPELSGIPVIIVSNLSDTKSIERAQQYRIEAYFTKSDISMGILLNRINRILKEKHVI